MALGSTPAVPKTPHPILLESPGGISGKLVTVLVAWTRALWSPEALPQHLWSLCPLLYRLPHPSTLPASVCSQVICCEGNAGFYEVGCVSTPLEGKHMAHTSYLCPLDLNVSPPMLTSPGLTSSASG